MADRKKFHKTEVNPIPSHQNGKYSRFATRSFEVMEIMEDKKNKKPELFTRAPKQSTSGSRFATKQNWD